MKKQTIKAWAICDHDGVVWTKEQDQPCDVPAVFRDKDEAVTSLPADFEMSLHGVAWEIHQVRVTIEPIKKPKRARGKK